MDDPNMTSQYLTESTKPINNYLVVYWELIFIVVVPDLISSSFQGNGAMYSTNHISNLHQPGQLTKSCKTVQSMVSSGKNNKSIGLYMDNGLPYCNAAIMLANALQYIVDYALQRGIKQS